MIKINTGSKFNMAAAAILKITFLAITRPLLHAFAPNLKQRLQMGSHRQIYRQNSHNAKIEDGSGRHFEISQTAIIPPVLNVFAPNLIYRLKMGSQVSNIDTPENHKRCPAARFTIKIHTLQKSKPPLF